MAFLIDHGLISLLMRVVWERLSVLVVAAFTTSYIGKFSESLLGKYMALHSIKLEKNVTRLLTKSLFRTSILESSREMRLSP